MSFQLHTKKDCYQNQQKMTTPHNTEKRKASGISPSSNFTPNFYNPFETKRRRRTSRDQAKLLEKAYNDNPKPNRKARHKLAEILSMSPRGVQVWFQNKRAKEKQQKAASKEEINFSTADMVHSYSQSSTYSDPVPLADQPQQPFMTWYNDIQLSPAQSQVQMDVPLSFGHQTYNQLQNMETSINGHAPQIQQYPFMYPENNTIAYHQSVGDWIDTVPLFYNDPMLRSSSKISMPVAFSHFDQSYWFAQ